MSTDDVRLAEAMQYKRTMTPAMPWSLVRCRCGCNGRASHLGLADGACMMSGCELTVRRWVRDLGGKAQAIGSAEQAREPGIP